MNSLNHYQTQSNKISYVLKKADRLGFYTEENADVAHNLLNLLRTNVFSKYVGKKLQYIVTHLNYKDIITGSIANECRKVDDIYRKTTTYFSVDSGTDIYEDSLTNKLEELGKEKKSIFLNISADKYCLDRDEYENYSTHGVCAILIPRRKSGYDLYYINPHGVIVRSTKYFDAFRSSTRTRRFALDCPVDCVVIQSLVNYINKNTNMDIHYDTTKKHNYYGTNLQEGDYHGICFILPIAIYYYLGKFYTEKKALVHDGRVKYVDCFRNLLRKGHIDRMVYCCFTDFNKKLEGIVFNNLGKSTDPKETILTCIGGAGTHFTKKITNTFISFLSQKYFMKNL